MSNEPYPHTVLLSLGSNLGDRSAYLKKAIIHLGRQTDIRNISSVYETDPVGSIEQNDFLNLALELKTAFQAHALMRVLLETEKNLGRQRAGKQGPRTIDIDIIFFDDLILNDDSLSIPHPRYAERNFVLVPLAEIAGEVRCPLRKTSVKEILKNSKDAHTVRKLANALPD